MPESNTTIAWIQAHLAALYAPGETHATADTNSDNLGAAFDETFAAGCEVRHNHETQSVQMLKDDLAGRLVAARHASVAWEGDVLSTNEGGPDSEEPVVVAGAFVVTRSLPFRIRAAPAQVLTHVWFSARVEQDASVQDGDRRRITSFYYASVDRAPPIHFAVPRTAQEGVDGL